MNKRIYTITLSVILMVSILFMGNLFIEDIKNVAISNNNINKFNKHILREGKYSLLLPEGWDIVFFDKNEDVNEIATFNQDSDIKGIISIIDGERESIYENIKGEIYSSKIIEEEYTWEIITTINEKLINNYYIRNYSKGKILILEISYNKYKEKNSIKAVFEYIAKSFN